jgi:alpha-beta hydrolase superfamily lysophospholipase
MAEEFTLTNLELRESTDSGEVGSGLSHRSMAGMFLLQVRELAARGEPRGAVTVVHDAGDHSRRYESLARDLAHAGWAVALPDLRGHGGSEGERGHSGGIAEVVRDLGEIQDHLAYRMPDAPKVLVGQGLGALYALAFALERTDVVRGLVLVAPLHEPRFEMPEQPRGVGKLFRKVGPRTPGRIGYKANQLTTDGTQALAWQNDSLAHDRITLRAAAQAEEAARACFPRLDDLAIPILVLHGTDDPIAEARRSKEMERAGVEVELFEGLRHHLLQETRAADVRKRIVQWLEARVTPA